jgi:hypothetical protein
MTTSPNIQAPHITANQNQKEVTANAATDHLDNAANRELTLDFAAGDVTLSDDQFNRNAVFRCTNATAGVILNLAARSRMMFIRNASGQQVTVRVTGGAGAGVAVADATNRIVYCDGADVVEFA